MKFSIITCTYNSQKYIKTCLVSLLYQSFRNFEVIIIDGHSSDKTIEIVEKFKKHIPLRIYQQEPKGISAAMNLGIKKAKGDFLLHLHSDDMLNDNDVLNDVNSFLKYSPYDWIYGKIDVIEENGESLGLFPNHKIFQYAWGYILKYLNYVPHQSVFIKKRVFESLGYFDETLSSQMDRDLWLRIYNKTKWKFFNRVIAKYRLHREAQSASIKNKFINQKNYEKVLKRYTNPTEFQLAVAVDKIINRDNTNLR